MRTACLHAYYTTSLSYIKKKDAGASLYLLLKESTGFNSHERTYATSLLAAASRADERHRRHVLSRSDQVTVRYPAATARSPSMHPVVVCVCVYIYIYIYSRVPVFFLKKSSKCRITGVTSDAQASRTATRLHVYASDQAKVLLWIGVSEKKRKWTVAKHVFRNLWYCTV
jgi:hypothetical protein